MKNHLCTLILASLAYQYNHMCPYHLRSQSMMVGMILYILPKFKLMDGPTISLPLPPPPPKQPAHCLIVFIFFTCIAKKYSNPKNQSLAKESNCPILLKSNQSQASSHSITSHSQHPGHEDGHTPFEDMHPEASTIKGKIPIKENSQMPKVT
jgi:hypothetical protein